MSDQQMNEFILLTSNLYFPMPPKAKELRF